MILIYCYDCEQVKYSFPRNLSCLSCGSQLVDEIPPVYSQDEEEDEGEDEEREEEGAELDEQSVLERLTTNVQHSSSTMANVNFHFIPRRSSLSMEEVKFRQWVMRHLLWNGDMTQMPIEILSSPLLSQFTTTEEEEASYIFRNWVMRQVLLPQQEDGPTAFVQWIKKHILGDRTELDYRRKMRQALSFPLQDITQQETSAYRTRVFRVLGAQPSSRFSSTRLPHHLTAFSDFERGFHFREQDDNETEDEEEEHTGVTDDDDDESDYEQNDDEEEEDLDTSEEELLDDVGDFTEFDGFSNISDTSDNSDIAHILPGSSHNTLDFLYNFITDNHDVDDSGSVNLSVLDELISEIRTRTETSRRERQPATRIISSLTEKRLAQDDPEYQTECSICQEIFSKEKLYVLPCRHVYHSECIDQWIRLKPTCPICRFSLTPSSPTLTSPYRSLQNPAMQEALRELERQEREILGNDADDEELHRGFSEGRLLALEREILGEELDDEIRRDLRDERLLALERELLDNDFENAIIHGDLGEEGLRALERQERLLLDGEFEEESDDDDEEEEEEEEEDYDEEDYEGTDTHIQNILESWPTDLWTDDEEEDAGINNWFLSSSDVNPYPLDSARIAANRQRARYTNIRRAIDPDDTDHLWRPSSFSATDSSPNVNQPGWDGLISLRSAINNDSSIHWFGLTSDHRHSYNDESLRSRGRVHHRYDQDQQLYFTDVMDID
ncbi:hypothetical protein K501DRAFT_331475 [Backusella circina FSU 941]|nr:hypothetical protein K501DRAFT_331475 [Backusella circina FSU 941]